MKIDIVIGAGFGDEGKGVVVNSLIKSPKDTLVVRFNGGQQAGHHVTYNRIEHTFSNFGSGTLKNVPTFWSKYCTVDPVGFIKEWEILKKKGITPRIIMDSECMITTPMDKHINMQTNYHGSVGVGFGQTIQRNEDGYRLCIRDLYNVRLRNLKISMMLKDYYTNKDYTNLVTEFKTACNTMLKLIESTNNDESEWKNPNRTPLITDNLYGHVIFEGAQGIMLDQKYGFFPHVTRSNTTSENALNIISESELGYSNVTTFYVTRAYQTRHGKGPMTTTKEMVDVIENDDETNTENYQGEFRKSILDVDLVNYAVSCDSYKNKSVKRMIVTCLDQVQSKFYVKMGTKRNLISFGMLQDKFKMPTIGCHSSSGF